MSHSKDNYSLLPILKWVGGKRDIINNIIEKFPNNINTYYELFVGGGSVFLELMNKCEKGEIKVQNFILNDLNTDLINLYKTIQNKSELEILIKHLKILTDNYKQAEMIKHPPRHKHIINDNENIEDIIRKGKAFLYYYYRDIFNSSKDDLIYKSALLIFLNKTCFRGLYREGPNGFNVPFGNYENPSIFDEEYLSYLNFIFNKYKLEFINKDFNSVIYESKISKDDYVYMDPPYYPITDQSFVSYKEEGFDEEKNKILVNLCKHLDKNKVKFLQSNSNATYILNSYKEFKIDKIMCKRRINSKNPESNTQEVLIYN